ncbi:MAG: sigma-70 family RNA polymerase sigma factor [Clostridiales bacterium]|nr:sigma-70 family RNA polymerase sigma factor [Clostridiales bacterium]
MNIRPLTRSQQRFAEENHALVYAFLNERRLPESVFYDIVIFGYLRAVQEYCEFPSLHRYKFSTVAWKHMRRALSNHYKYLSRPKRCAPTVSLDALIVGVDGLCWEDVVSRTDERMLQIETELILHALTPRLPRKTMRIVRMKIRGDRMQDIAKSERMTFHDINQWLSDSYPVIMDVLFG